MIKNPDESLNISKSKKNGSDDYFNRNDLKRSMPDENESIKRDVGVKKIKKNN